MIRNPWSRVVSQFNFGKGSKASFWYSACKPFDDVNDFLNDSIVQQRLYRESRIPYDGGSSEVLVTSLFRIEDTAQIMQQLLTKGVKVTAIPRLNVSVETFSVRNLSASSRRFVGEIYFDDIVNGNYSLDA